MGEEIDRWDPTPVYQQLAAIYSDRIKTGKLIPRQPLPSETRMMGEHGVSRGTVRHAIELLRAQGWVRTIGQRGTYVNPESEWPPDEPEGSPQE